MMYRTLAYFAVFAFFVISSSFSDAAQHENAAQPATSKTVLRGGWIYDPELKKVTRNRGIVVLNGEFFTVGVALDGGSLSGANVIDLSDDEYAIPGLIDTHAHYDVALVSQRRVDDVRVNPVVYLANGVTSTFTAGEYDPYVVREARLRINRGEQTGPRIFQAGPKFGVANPRWDKSASTEDVEAIVDRWAELGVAGFKAYGLSRPQLQALIARAHQHGLTVTGHLLGRGYINPKEAILMGIDKIEHYPGGDHFPTDEFAYEHLPDIDTESPEFQDIVNLFVKHRVYYNPTLTRFSYLGRSAEDLAEILPYWIDERALFTPWVQNRTRNQPPPPRPDYWREIPESLRKAAKAFYESGAEDLMTLGTDNPSTGYYLPGFDAHRELYNFVLAGIPAEVALKFGTLNGARWLNLAERLGSIDTGKWADLFVIKGNPLDDIRNTRNIRFVMKAGQIYYPDELLRSVEGKLGPLDREEEQNW